MLRCLSARKVRNQLVLVTISDVFRTLLCKFQDRIKKNANFCQFKSGLRNLLTSYLLASWLFNLCFIQILQHLLRRHFKYTFQRSKFFSQIPRLVLLQIPINCLSPVRLATCDQKLLCPLSSEPQLLPADR